MCGMPHVALPGYLRKLVSQGLRVAICEQMEPAAVAKSRGEIVRRDVVRLVTPGTLTEDEFLVVRTAGG